jgi:hypothetical protein
MQGSMGLWAIAPPGVVALIASLGVQFLIEGKRPLGWGLVAASLLLGTAVVTHQAYLQPASGGADARAAHGDVLVASRGASPSAPSAAVSQERPPVPR